MIEGVVIVENKFHTPSLTFRLSCTRTGCVKPGAFYMKADFAGVYSHVISSIGYSDSVSKSTSSASHLYNKSTKRIRKSFSTESFAEK